jgi:hypothetical protein
MDWIHAVQDEDHGNEPMSSIKLWDIQTQLFIGTVVRTSDSTRDI